MEFLLQANGPIGRGAFALRLAGVLAVGAGTMYGAYQAGYHFLHFETVGVFFALVMGLVTAIVALLQMMRRCQDLGLPTVFLAIPVFNLYLLALLFFAPSKKHA